MNISNWDHLLGALTVYKDSPLTGNMPKARSQWPFLWGSKIIRKMSKMLDAMRENNMSTQLAEQFPRYLNYG